MSLAPEPLDFPSAEPVTVEQALVVVASWRASGMPLYGLHQVVVALANAYEKEQVEHRQSLGAARNILAAHQRRAAETHVEVARLERENAAWRAEVKQLNEEIDNLEADVANNEGYTECVEGAFDELCQAVGVSAGRIPGRDVESDPEDWDSWLAGVREKFARLERDRRGLSAYRDSLLILLDAARAETARLLVEAERSNAAMLRLAGRIAQLDTEGDRFMREVAGLRERIDHIADAALGCSEGMACRRPVWFGCCATRKRICGALGVEFHVERAGSSGSSVIDDVGSRAATVPGEGG